MTRLSRRGFASLAVSLMAAPLLISCASETVEETRIVSLGGDLTEIVYALGHIDDVVARDSTSLYPASVQDLPDVGYVRSLGAEPVLSMAPSLIIASSEAGPPEVIDQVQSSGVPIVQPPEGYSQEILEQRIQVIGDALGEAEQAQALIEDIRSKMARVATVVSEQPEKPKVLFLLQARDGSPMAAGTDTAANAMIELAGGENIFSTHSGYKPFSLEVLAEAKPDALMLMDHSLTAMGGKEALKNHPAIGLTPAAQNGKVIAADGLFLLGFGPRLPEAVAYVAEELHGDLGLDLASG
ncbi:MAG: ABC transporter substrate-binding protein [Pseudomonadota bacterium]